MANALAGLSCHLNDLKNCYNPHFYAYGQLPLYLGRILIWFYNKIFNQLVDGVSFVNIWFPKIWLVVLRRRKEKAPKDIGVIFVFRELREYVFYSFFKI